jgi:hypothetical protein
MPERLSYDEAMLFSTVRLKILDSQIKQGKVETVTVQTQAGQMIRPWGMEGGFAVVYKFRTLGGQLRALRCFRVPMKPDTQFRYEHIGPYFHKHAAAITAGFKYHDQGILVKEQGKQGGTIYPIIEMDWVDGVTLVEKLEELCQKRDRATLKNLSDQWLTILTTLQKAHIAHGDLAGVNVMVRSDGRMILIDYDGVYIPEFAGLPQILLGQPDFQHPQMGKRPFNEHMDAFSALVIYTVLLALSAQPELWQKHMKRSPQGTLLDVNLLLTQSDFQHPQQSAIFRDLEQSSNPQVRTLTKELKRACQQPIEQVRFPFHLIDSDYEKKQALAELAQAIQSDDDARIAGTWVPTLEHYPPAQIYRARVQQAKQQLTALAGLRAALQSQLTERILAEYDATLDRSLTADESRLIDIARRFVNACDTNDDEAIITLSNSIQSNAMLLLTAQQQQRVAQARQRKQARQQFNTALSSKDLAQIATAYASLQQYVPTISAQEQQLGELATNFMQAYHTHDEDALIAAYDAIQNFKYRTYFDFSLEQKQHIELALQHEQAITQFRVALMSRSTRRVGEAFTSQLEKSSRLTADEREQGQRARAFATAYAEDDDDALVAAYTAVRNRASCRVFSFSSEETQRVELAQRRREATIKLQSALATKKPLIIVASYNAILDNRLAPETREQVQLARRIAEARDDDQLYEAYEAVQSSRYRSLLEFTPQEQQRITAVRQRKAALQSLEDALKRSEPEAIIATYEALAESLQAQLAPHQQQRVAQARHALAMRNAIQQAIQDNDHAAILKAYEPALAQLFPQLIQPWLYHHIDNARKLEQVRLENARKSEQLQIARRSSDYALALRTAKENPVAEILDGQESYLIVAMRRVLRDIQLTGVETAIEATRNGNLLKVSWHWPDNDLIQYIVILWDGNLQPGLPRQLNDTDWRSVKNCVLVARESHRREGQRTLAISTHTLVFTMLYAAMYNEWDRSAEIKIWCLSPAVERIAQLRDKAPTSKW